MDEDKFALVEKILKDVDIIFSKNAELYSFDIIPSENNFQNKSPVLHLENCLGLESWCVKHVYMYCYSELVDKFLSKNKRKPVRVTAVTFERLTRLLNITLLLNPDLTTFWNKRREIVQKELLDKHSELRFAKLVLSRKPKANDAFAYRRWIIENLEGELNDVDIEALFTEELHICDQASEKVPNNYHSWNHRLWLLNFLKILNPPLNLHALFIKEYIFSERWMSKHVSDYCSYHYRQFCIKNIFLLNPEDKTFETAIDVNLRLTLITVITANLPKDMKVQISKDNLVAYSNDNLLSFLLSHTLKRCSCNVNNLLVSRKLEVLFHELVLNNDLIRFYKYHETLWYHRRFIIHTILEVIHEYFGLVKQKGALVKKSCTCDEFKAKMIKYDVSLIYSCSLYKSIVSHEKDFIKERQEDGDNYADRHEKYLKFVEGINNFN